MKEIAARTCVFHCSEWIVQTDFIGIYLLYANYLVASLVDAYVYTTGDVEELYLDYTALFYWHARMHGPEIKRLDSWH